MSLLSVDQLTIRFATTVVDEVAFTLEKQQTLALVGESGSGKTLTGLAMMQLLPNTAKVSQNASIKFDNQELLDLPEIDMRRVRGKRIAMIFQEALAALNPTLTIGQQIEEVLKTHFKLTRRQRRHEVDDLLAQVGLKNPGQIRQSYAHQLSGGMRQRAMIAMALAGKPELLIADEPTTALDVTIQQQILSLLQRLRHELGMSLLFITHDLGIVKHIADDIVVLQQGKVVEAAKTNQFFIAPKQQYSQALLQAVLPPKPKREVLTADVNLLTVTGLKTYFPIKRGVFKRTVDYVKAVDDVSLKIERGKTLALVGESGSGKTTCGLSLLRLIHPTAGKITFAGSDIQRLTSSKLLKLRKKMQIIFQDPYSSMNPRMLIGDIIQEGMLAQKIGNKKQRSQRVEELLQLVGLEPAHQYRYPHEFSGGQRQRICIARALAVEPEFIVCDEPTSALDVTIQHQILDLLLDLQHRLGITYLLITHNIGVVGYMAHDVAVMRDGKIIETGTAEDVLLNPQHDYTKELLSAVPVV